MNNKKLGNDFEAEFCEILFENGFWAHNMAQNQSGQPADVLAAKNGTSYLIDCKVCSNRGFTLSRIEENQALSMGLWEQCGNGTGWFAILVDSNIRMFSFPYLKYLGERTTILSKAELLSDGMSLEDWLEE